MKKESGIAGSNLIREGEIGLETREESSQIDDLPRVAAPEFAHGLWHIEAKTNDHPLMLRPIGNQVSTRMRQEPQMNHYLLTMDSLVVCIWMVQVINGGVLVDDKQTLVLRKSKDGWQQAAKIFNREGRRLDTTKLENQNYHSPVKPPVVHDPQILAKSPYNNPSISWTTRKIRNWSTQNELTNLPVPPQLHTSCSLEEFTKFVT